jgi:hypothetical protein
VHGRPTSLTLAEEVALMRRILVVLVTAVAIGTVGFVGVALVDPEKIEGRSL